MVHNISGEQVQSAEMLLSHYFWKWVVGVRDLIDYGD